VDNFMLEQTGEKLFARLTTFFCSRIKIGKEKNGMKPVADGRRKKVRLFRELLQINHKIFKTLAAFSTNMTL
jgi:hypothetical protein